MKMSYGKGSLGWMYYEMEYGYIFTGAYDPYYWGYSPYLSPKHYSPESIGKNTDGMFSKRLKRPL
jgi:hypothetical protein